MHWRVGACDLCPADNVVRQVLREPLKFDCRRPAMGCGTA